MRSGWLTRTMCRVMAVSHSGFYEWMGREPSQRSQDDARLPRLIRESFELSDRTHGSPRVWHNLRALGESCGMNRVIRLMHLVKLQARHKRRRLSGDAGSRLENHIAPIHLDSPLRGLSSYKAAPVEQLRGATRGAPKQLVTTAIDYKVSFVMFVRTLKHLGLWR